MIAANIAADLTAWARLLGFRDDAELKNATPDTLRYRVWHIPARLVRHARKRILKISPDWPGMRRSSPAGTGSALSQHPADQHKPPRRQRKETPGPRGSRPRPGHTGQHPMPPAGTQPDTKLKNGLNYGTQGKPGEPDSLRLACRPTMSVALKTAALLPQMRSSAKGGVIKACIARQLGSAAQQILLGFGSTTETLKEIIGRGLGLWL
jgi:hypothetical protein